MSAKSFNFVISHRGSDFVGFTPIVEDNIQLLNLQKTCECSSMFLVNYHLV